MEITHETAQTLTLAQQENQELTFTPVDAKLSSPAYYFKGDLPDDTELKISGDVISPATLNVVLSKAVGPTKLENLLYSANNPRGVYLEEVLRTLAKELTDKTIALSQMDQMHPAVQTYRAANSEIVSLLNHCIGLQEHALELAKEYPINQPYQVVQKPGQEPEIILKETTEE